MYEVVSGTPKDIIAIYIMFIGACLVTYPIIRFIIGAVTKGLSKWT